MTRHFPHSTRGRRHARHRRARAAAHVQAQKPASQAELLLGKALNLEDVAGNLKDAIATYEQVLKAPDATRAQKARAQFRIGACYERLGVDGARKAYEAVVANYGDMADFASQARTRLEALGGGASSRVAGASTEVLRQMWPGETGVLPSYLWHRISPDGRQMAGCQMKGGDVVVRELEGGRVKNLTNRAAAGPEQSAFSCLTATPIWSRDGRFVAMDWSGVRRPAE